MLVNRSAISITASAVGFIRLRHGATGPTSLAAGCDTTTNLQACVLAPIYVFPVAAGVQTFTLGVVKQRSAGDMIVDEGTITALFVPFGTDGGTTNSTSSRRLVAAPREDSGKGVQAACRPRFPAHVLVEAVVEVRHLP